MRTCEHYEHGDWMVTPSRPTREHFAVRCPCCGLEGWDHADNAAQELMCCPHCKVPAELVTA